MVSYGESPGTRTPSGSLMSWASGVASVRLVVAAERVERADHAEAHRHHRVLVAGLAHQRRHRRGATGADHVVDGEVAAGDVVVDHHLHGRAAGLVVAAAGAVGDDHQDVAAVVAARHPAAGQDGRAQQQRRRSGHQTNPREGHRRVTLPHPRGRCHPHPRPTVQLRWSVQLRLVLGACRDQAHVNRFGRPTCHEPVVRFVIRETRPAEEDVTVTDEIRGLAERFEGERPRLRGIAMQDAGQQPRRGRRRAGGLAPPGPHRQGRGADREPARLADHGRVPDLPRRAPQPDRAPRGGAGPTRPTSSTPR